MSSCAYQFGSWLVEPELNRITSGTAEKHLEPLSMDILSYLLEYPNQVVSADRLLEIGWSNRVVERNAVPRVINEIRRALGDDPRRPRYIQTIRKRGYRAVGAVEKRPASNVSLQAIEPTHPFIRSDAIKPAGPTEAICSAIAFLPVVNTSEDELLDQLCQVMSEDLEAGLCFYPARRFVGALEAARYVDAGMSSVEIARELKVGTVISGSARLNGNNVRFSIDVVACTGEQVLAQRLENFKDDVSESLERTTDALQWAIVNAIRGFNVALAAKTPIDELGAWGLANRAWCLMDAVGRQSRKDMRYLLECAISLEPSEPFFKAMLARTLGSWILQGASEHREADAHDARRLADESLRSISRQVPPTIMMAGSAYVFLGDHRRGFALMERGYQMNPRLVVNKWDYAKMLLYAGRAKEALVLHEEAALALLPGMIRPFLDLSLANAVLGELKPAMEFARQAVDNSSRQYRVIAIGTYANVLARMDRLDEAVQAIERLRADVPHLSLKGVIDVFHRLFATGDSREATTSGLQKLIDLGIERS